MDDFRDFASFSTVFQLFQDDVEGIMRDGAPSHVLAQAAVVAAYKLLDH